jgi:hypothetical protein
VLQSSQSRYVTNVTHGKNYFNEEKTRSATVRAGAAGALVLKFRLTRAELGMPQFAGLKKYLGAQAWDRFVSNSQRSI